MQLVALRDWYPKYVGWTGTLVPETDRVGWVVHHTVGGIDEDPEAYARIVADYHYDRWGVPGGYSYLIGEDGLVRVMCGLSFEGVHSGTHEWNWKSLGLAFQGDFRQAPPSKLMLDAARDLIADTPIPAVQWGHRDVRPDPTSCPGQELYDLLPLKEDPVSLPVNADSDKEEIRHVQEMLGVAATGEWDFPAALEGLRDRSGTGDTRDHVNGRMYTQLLGEFIGRTAPDTGGVSVDTVRDLIRQHASNPDAHHE